MQITCMQHNLYCVGNVVGPMSVASVVWLCSFGGWGVNYVVLATLVPQSWYKRHYDFIGFKLQEGIPLTVNVPISTKLRDQAIEVSVDRWSLYRGVLVSLNWPMWSL